MFITIELLDLNACLAACNELLGVAVKSSKNEGKKINFFKQTINKSKL
jgi:hypothetical protein